MHFPPNTLIFFWFAVSFYFLPCHVVSALNVVLAGGSGEVGKSLASKLPKHRITILSRNSFLASAPNRVTDAFGFVGLSFLKKHPHVSIRDWVSTLIV